jgi:hypothetical protein
VQRAEGEVVRGGFGGGGSRVWAGRGGGSVGV